MLQLKKPLAVIDIEATGSNVTTDRIVEIAVVKYLVDGNRTVKRKIINPLIPIPPAITDIHGITDDMVKDAPTLNRPLRRLSST
jgi:DNA polymerase-3 subunit epsilon